MDTEAIVERLDLMNATLRLAYSAEIGIVRERVRSDAVSAAILDATAEDWVRSGDLQTNVGASTNVNVRTVQRRFQELVSMGALRQRGSDYRSTGLI